MNAATTYSGYSDLLFELSDTGETKICLAISNLTKETSRIATKLCSDLSDRGLSWVLIKVTDGDLDLADELHRRVEVDAVDVAIVDLNSLSPPCATSVFAILNFRRDYILKMGVPICFWLSSGLLAQLIEKAPDFWSRRTATYYFSHPSVEDLLTRLFGAPVEDALTDRASHRMWQALATIAYYEPQIRDAVTPEERMDVSRFASKIRTETDVLIAECDHGNAFSVAFALWMQAHLDEYMQRLFYKRMGRGARLGFQSVYEDRNDVLFELAGQTRTILSKYADSISERIEEKKPVSLTGYFRTAAEFKLKDLIRKARAEESKRHPRSPDEMTEHEQSALIETETIEDAIRCLAAENLLQCLEDPDAKLPAFFTNDETEALRLLYSSKRPKSTSRKIERLFGENSVAKLQEKVRTFLENAGVY